MSLSNQQLQQAIHIIEEQLAQLKQAAGLPADSADQPGIVGTYDGEFMTTEEGRRYPIPPNYASKSMLVPGDTIRMIEDPSKDPSKTKFKQIGKAERLKTTGLLARKDGKFEVLSEEGSFKVLSAAIKHYDGQPGDTVAIQYPRNHVKGSYAAVEKVIKAGTGTAAAAPAPAPMAGAAVPPPPPPAISAQPIQLNHAPQPQPEATAPTPPTPITQPVVASVDYAVPAPVAEVPVIPPAPAPAAPQPAPAPTPKPAAEPRQAERKPNDSRRSTDAKRPSSSSSSNRSNDRRSDRTDKPRSTDRPRSDHSDRPARPTTQPTESRPAAPAPQSITPGATGEISVAEVMDDDDLM